MLVLLDLKDRVVPNWPLMITGFTHVVSAVGNALMRLQPAMINAAIRARVTHVYASEWNSNMSQKESLQYAIFP